VYAIGRRGPPLPKRLGSGGGVGVGVVRWQGGADVEAGVVGEQPVGAADLTPDKGKGVATTCGQVGRERPADVGSLLGADAQRLGSQSDAVDHRADADPGCAVAPRLDVDGRGVGVLADIEVDGSGGAGFVSPYGLTAAGSRVVDHRAQVPTVARSASTFASWRAPAGSKPTRSTPKTIEANNKLVLLTPTAFLASPPVYLSHGRPLAFLISLMTGLLFSLAHKGIRLSANTSNTFPRLQCTQHTSRPGPMQTPE
jgi:hypothetical protein